MDILTSFLGSRASRPFRKPDSGGRKGRGTGKGATRVLFAGTLSAGLFFALSALFSESPLPAGAMGLDNTVRPFTVDQDLILGPGGGDGTQGALFKRAVSLAQTPEVQTQIEHFLTDKRSDIEQALALSTRYLPHIVPVLKEQGLPAELAYLCVIESGYMQSARSHAGAVGMWQMIRSTSRRFDLRTDAWVDERMDFLRSTEGAADFIRYLRERFDDWDHVLAAYNAGEGRVRSAVRRAGQKGLSPDMENLPLPRETRIYVPAFYAALLICMEPERYGLFPNFQPVLDYLEVAVPGGVSFSTLAQRLGCRTEDLAGLNPSILKGRVPVGGDYPVKIPCWVGEARAKSVVASLKEVHYVSYHVRKGDTLWDIAKKFGVHMSRIIRSGHHQGNPTRIFPGEVLLVALTAGEAI